jgi:two-component system, sensor histidine kinase and response regulator
MARIIVIDNDPDILETVARVLHAEHHDVTVAVNGAQGIQLIKSRPPDLILCDISMPIMDGYAVFQTVKNDAKTSGIPFVFVTARGARSEQRKGMELGADDYLIKPFSAKELLSCVRTQIVKHHLLTDRYESTLRMVRKNIIYALPHELRTPLSQIIGYAGLLEMEADPLVAATAKDYGKRITQASERLEHLIENYLVYAQIEIVASSLDELEKLRNHIVQDAAPIIEKSVNERAHQHKREKDVKTKLVACALHISESDLTKITGELVDNAFKFSSAGSPVVIETLRTEVTYQITVRDKGHGMSEEQIALLDAYMQFDRAFYEQQGVGLGFIIAKRLTELHGGKIKLESQQDVGTTIHVIFPI